MNKINEENEQIFKSRKFHIVFEPPFFSFVKGVYTTISQEDLINIYRQLKHPHLKKQIKKIINAVNSQQDLKIDIDTYKLSRVRKESKNEREVVSYKHNKKIQ